MDPGKVCVLVQVDADLKHVECDDMLNDAWFYSTDLMILGPPRKSHTSRKLKPHAPLPHQVAHQVTRGYAHAGSAVASNPSSECGVEYAMDPLN